MRPYDLIIRQMALEGIGVDDRDQLVRCAAPYAEAIPRCYVAWDDVDYHVFIRHDLPDTLAATLRALPAERLFHDRASIVALLAPHEPIAAPECYKSYVSTTPFAEEVYGQVVRLDRAQLTVHRHPDHPLPDNPTTAVYAIVVDDQLAATCWSIREDAGAAEAWVYTHPSYRWRGYARQVTAAWASGAHAQQKTPFYSHHWENRASQHVAESLRLTRFSTGVTYL